MITFYFIFLPVFYTLIKTFLFLIVSKYGKFSYDGFSAMGFAYNSKKDLFYTTKDAWQKNFGYSHLYDVGAPLFRMIIDTEPVKFFYNDKNWLITFWKGQYGIVTGAEVGVYCTNQKKVNKKTLYLPASDTELLDISFTLYKKGKIIADIKNKHWWLAAFKLGMFSKPKDLSMDIKIDFPNYQMLEAFLISFRKLGYKTKDFMVINNTFIFNYKKPKTHKVWTRSWLFDKIRQSANHRNVKRYNKYLDDFIDNNKIDDSKLNTSHLIMVDKFVPDILKNGDNKEILPKDLQKKIFLNNKVFSNNYVNEKKIK